MYCRRCGAALHEGVVICPECGARQRRGISSVRCARCGQRVPLGLTVCPHCGRDVHPAGPRWGLWLAGFAVIALAAFWGLGELPIDRIGAGVASARSRVAQVVQFLGPVASPAAVPSRTATPQALAALPDKPTSTPTEVAPEEENVPAAPGESATGEAVGTTTGAGSPTLEPLPTEATATPTATQTLEPTATPSPTPTQTPTTAPPAATSTAPAPAPAGRVTYQVRSGDTLSSIAARYGIEWQELARANGLTSGSMLRIGQELVIPVPGSAPAAAPTAAPKSAGTTYKVKSGDSLSSIAAQFGLTWQDLAAANGLTAQSRLNVGQELIIPGTGGATQPIPAVPPAPTPTASPAPTAVPLLPAPALVSPADQVPYQGGTAFIELMWQPVDGVPPGAGYRVTIQWTEQGGPMEYQVPLTTAHSIRMPAWLWQRADQPTRRYTWSVRVVQTTTDGHGGEKDLLLSPSSETRTLYWY